MTKQEKLSKATARAVGVLFLLATATYITGNGLLESILTMPDYLSQVYPHSVQVVAGALLVFVDTAAVVGIGVLLFPILKRFNESIAIGYVATRVVEFVFLVFGAIGPLMLITLSQDYVAAGVPDAAHFQTAGSLFMTQHFLGYQIGMMALGFGSLFFCYLLYTSKLIPQWMSLLGFVGYAALFIGAVLELFGLSVGLMLSIPGGIFELILPLWLIVKGFNVAALTAPAPKNQAPTG
ncbi:MAG: DUF4386 domain-containing protein [Ardenticatenaceae bacterium]|nr:DUF4386 domain-containing protein [Ardenticatenaceae bacterium]